MIKRIRKQIKRLAQEHLVVAFLRFCSRQPLTRLQRWGQWLGNISYRINGKSVKITRRNLSRVRPELSAEQLEQQVRLSMQETGKIGMELGWSWMAPLDEVLGSVRHIYGRDVLDRAHAGGKGAIILGPHLGNWEVFGLLIQHLYPFSAMYAVPKNPKLEPVILQGRSRGGLKMVQASVKGVAHLLKALKRGEMVGNLPDQEPDDRSGGVFAPFMGVDTFSPKLVTRLISKTEATVIAGFACRLPQGEGFDIYFVDADAQIYSSDETLAVAAMNRTVEQLIAIAPEQYQWEYKRFKTRPEGEPGFYQSLV